MSALNALGTVVATSLLAPGNLACDRLGIAHDGARELVRMLVNTLFWTAVGVLVVLGLA